MDEFLPRVMLKEAGESLDAQSQVHREETEDFAVKTLAEGQESTQRCFDGT